MGALFIDAGNRIAPSVMAENSVHLVSVMVRIFHSDNRFYRAQSLQEPVYHLLFDCKLFFVGEVKILAGAAFFVHGTGAPAFAGGFFPGLRRDTGGLSVWNLPVRAFSV